MSSITLAVFLNHTEQIDVSFSGSTLAIEMNRQVLNPGFDWLGPLFSPGEIFPWIYVLLSTFRNSFSIAF